MKAKRSKAEWEKRAKEARENAKGHEAKGNRGAAWHFRQQAGRYEHFARRA